MNTSESDHVPLLSSSRRITPDSSSCFLSSAVTEALDSILVNIADELRSDQMRPNQIKSYKIKSNQIKSNHLIKWTIIIFR